MAASTMEARKCVPIAQPDSVVRNDAEAALNLVVAVLTGVESVWQSAIKRNDFKVYTSLYEFIHQLGL